MDKLKNILEQANNEYKNENYQLALQLYTEVLELDSNNFVAIRRVDELKEKVQTLTPKIESPSNGAMEILHNTLLRLAKSSKEQQMYEKSISLYAQILEVNPQHKEALIGIAEVYWVKGQKDIATEYMNRAEAL